MFRITSFLTKIKKLTSTSKNPCSLTEGSAGYDVYVDRVEDCGNYIKVYTGISIQPTSGYYFLLFPRSSTYKKGLMLYNSVGVIDQDYTGEIIAIFHKTADFKELPKQDERIAQLVPQKLRKVDFQEVDKFISTSRGEGAFGSTDNGQG